MSHLVHRLNLDVGSWTTSNAMLQCAVYEPVDAKWYLSQALPAGRGDIEDTRISRFNRDGGYEGVMVLSKFGHGAHIGVRKSDADNVWIWVPLDDYDADGDTSRTRIAETVWKAGTKTRDGARVRILDSNLSGGLGGFSLSWPYVYVRGGRAVEEIYTKHREDDLERGRDMPINKLVVPKKGRPGPFQGCAARGDHLFVLSGSTNKTNSIEWWSWSKKKKNAELDISVSLLRSALKGKVPTTGSLEPEGLEFVDDQLVMGVRCGPAGKSRTFALLDINL